MAEKSVNWQGSGGFEFYKLAPTLIIKDKYDAQMLVAAIAKLNGYVYAPNVDIFWKQGSSQTGSYIYIRACSHYSNVPLFGQFLTTPPWFFLAYLY